MHGPYACIPYPVSFPVLLFIFAIVLNASWLGRCSRIYQSLSNNIPRTERRSNSLDSFEAEKSLVIYSARCDGVDSML